VASAELRYWDACAFLAYLREEEGRVDGCQRVLDEAKAGRIRIVTSALTLTEVLKVKGQPPLPESLEQQIDAAFRQDYLVLRNVDRRTGELARFVVWRHGIAPKDSIHVATALLARVDRLDTFDDDLLGLSGLELEGLGPLVVCRAEVDGPTQLQLGSVG
jgi:predicted nucleic acid-binding protein